MDIKNIQYPANPYPKWKKCRKLFYVYLRSKNLKRESRRVLITAFLENVLPRRGIGLTLFGGTVKIFLHILSHATGVPLTSIDPSIALSSDSRSFASRKVDASLLLKRNLIITSCQPGKSNKSLSQISIRAFANRQRVCDLDPRVDKGFKLIEHIVCRSILSPRWVFITADDSFSSCGIRQEIKVIDTSSRVNAFGMNYGD